MAYDLLTRACCTGIASGNEDAVAGVATVGAPIFDHRGALLPALEFNRLPETLRADAGRNLEFAPTASAESRGFGYELEARELPVPS